MFAHHGVYLMEKILVTCDSGYGSTAAAAGTIAETLAEKGISADLRPVGIADLSGYDSLFLGSPIRLGRCTPKVKNFLKKNLTALTSMPAARIRLMENNHTASYYLKRFLKFIPNVTPSGVAFFNGSLNVKKLTPVHRLIMCFAMFSLPEITNGDFLRPLTVKSWTQRLFHRMKMPESADGADTKSRAPGSQRQPDNDNHII